MDVNLEPRQEVASAIHTCHRLVRNVIERMRPVEFEPTTIIQVLHGRDRAEMDVYDYCTGLRWT